MAQSVVSTNESRTASLETANLAPSRPIRVCYLIDNLNHGGTELRLLRLIRNHARQIVEPCLSLLDGTTPASIELKPTCCEVRSWEIKSIRSLSTARKVLKFAHYLREEQIDVLQIYYRDSMLVGIPAAFLAGVPHVIMNAFNLGYWMTSIDRWLYRRYAPFIHRMIVNCQAVKDSLTSQLNLLPDKITVIENGIDLDSFTHVPSWTPPSASSNLRRIGMVANLRGVKDPMTFLIASAIVHERHPNTRFVIAGEGTLRLKLEAMIIDLGLLGIVDLPGLIIDTPSFLSTLDIAVLCSQSEGMSNAVIEYMATGRPIVVTAVGGNTELIAHEKTGLLVPSNSPVEIANSITRYLDNPRFASQIALNARDESLRRFDSQLMTRRYEDFYASL